MDDRLKQKILTFLWEITEDWDCDSGENGKHHYQCRSCAAKLLLEEIQDNDSNNIGIDGWPI